MSRDDASNPWASRMAGPGVASELLLTAQSPLHELADQALTTKQLPARPGDAERLAEHADIGPLLREGHRYVGRKRQRAGLFGRFHSHVLVHPDGVACVLVRAEKDLAPHFSRWFVLTLFDDGSALETSSQRQPAIPSSERFTSRGGVGSLPADVTGHLEALREELARGDRRVLPARDLADAIAHERILLRHAYSQEVARSSAELRQNELALAALQGGTATLLGRGVDDSDGWNDDDEPDG